jgi:hypothetical protein
MAKDLPSDRLLKRKDATRKLPKLSCEPEKVRGIIRQRPDEKRLGSTEGLVVSEPQGLCVRLILLVVFL